VVEGVKGEWYDCYGVENGDVILIRKRDY